MFARTIVALFLGVAAVSVSAAPLASRQLGNLECNLDRLAIVTSLIKTQSSLKDLKTSFADDATALSAVEDTIKNVGAAQDAIGVIGKALVTFQKAPPEARVTVLDSLKTAVETMGTLESEDAGIKALLAQTQAEVAQGLAAGQGVVSTCK